MASSAAEVKTRVRDFWQREPCGSIHADAPEGSREYFDQVERRRQELEPFIARFADFEGAHGKLLLEIGVGLGTDFIRFARAGARASGVDLTPRAVELVRRRLENEGLDGEVLVGDAERLPFPDASFDRVYSWGVLHHTPDTMRAIREAIRVCRPGGELCVMLYARHSWGVYGLWLRYALLAGRPRRSLADILAEHMESEGTKGYRIRTLRSMFGGLEGLRIDRVAPPFDRQIAGPLAPLTARWLGYYVVVRGRAPASRHRAVPNA